MRNGIFDCFYSTVAELDSFQCRERGPQLLLRYIEMQIFSSEIFFFPVLSGKKATGVKGKNHTEMKTIMPTQIRHHGRVTSGPGQK